MTKEEFERWALAYFGAFPDAYRWLDGLPEKGKHTLDAWYQTLQKCQYADLALVTSKVIAGELDPPGMIISGNYKQLVRELTARDLKSYCDRISDDRRRRQKTEALHRQMMQGKEQARQQRGPRMSAMYATIIKFREEAKEQGILDEDEIRAYASEKFERWYQENHEHVSVGPKGDNEAF